MRFAISIEYAQDPDQTYVAARVLHWTYVYGPRRRPSVHTFPPRLVWSLSINFFVNSVLEANIGLICGCAIAFPAFFDASAPRSFGSLVGSLLAKASASQTSILSPPRSRKGAERGLRLSEGSQSQSKSRWGKLSRPSKQNIYNEMAEDRNLTG